MDGIPKKIRIDKWLWWARFFKTRSLSTKIITKGSVRVNSRRIFKPSVEIKVDDVLTFTAGKSVRVIKVLSLGERRVNYDEARKMYENVEDND